MQLFPEFQRNALLSIHVEQGWRFESANPNAAAYAGCTLEDLIGKKPDSIVYPENRRHTGGNALRHAKSKRSLARSIRHRQDGIDNCIMEREPVILRAGPPFWETP